MKKHIPDDSGFNELARRLRAATVSYIMRRSYQTEIRLIPKIPGSYWHNLAEEILKDVLVKRTAPSNRECSRP